MESRGERELKKRGVVKVDKEGDSVSGGRRSRLST